MAELSTQLAAQSVDIANAASFDALFQGIHCGSLRIAVSYRWARSIVDRFDELPVPKAPVWLSGAAAIDGQIHPIIDIALLKDPTHVRSVSRRDLNLLVGGSEDGDLQNPLLAILFDGAPQQLRDTGENSTAVDAATVSGALAPFISHGLRSSRDEVFYVLDMAKLADRLASELSTL
ncbi:MAG: hypothetical protein EAZ30_05190 [Betaproteobacteria bacterium]|nr:MAG: hypothetical protein EAZ30_05190 [Betaproteobacteria bacterium]